uniref:Uncharacterized protein n=1 Tax=Arundo donax TaxID=35708 RepID=A0A0A9A3W5_ARUDO
MFRSNHLKSVPLSIPECQTTQITQMPEQNGKSVTLSASCPCGGQEDTSRGAQAPPPCTSVCTSLGTWLPTFSLWSPAAPC